MPKTPTALLIPCLVVPMALALAGAHSEQETNPPPRSQPVTTPVQTSLPSVTLPAELERVLRDYEKAWMARDARGLAALFAEDGFVLRGGHPPVRGREAIERAYQGAGGPLALRALEFRAEQKVGWIIGAYAGSADAADAGKFVLALSREEEGGRWQIAGDMDNGNAAVRRQ